jgi:hypothetical protein
MKRSQRSRQLKSSIYNHLYKIVSWVDRISCYYCGDRASGYDHVPPMAWVESLGSSTFRENGVDFLKVPCCTHCNSVILGPSSSYTLEDRLKEVKRHLQREVAIRNGVYKEIAADRLRHVLYRESRPA